MLHLIVCLYICTAVSLFEKLIQLTIEMKKGPCIALISHTEILFCSEQLHQEERKFLFLAGSYIESFIHLMYLFFVCDK